MNVDGSTRPELDFFVCKNGIADMPIKLLTCKKATDSLSFKLRFQRSIKDLLIHYGNSSLACI